MGHEEVLDKNGNPIHKGDYVVTRIRGGTHEGKAQQSTRRSVDLDGDLCADSSSDTQVEEIITDEERAQEIDVKHPPKVLFRNKNGKQVAHNPGTLHIDYGHV
ncbi:uncharacterized protein N7477_002394 [Penicillium maclennaniae]|uniref:uncharacterized protein n=1 Tax=Penicillium maclennaniae TaxID=1343394 RepID=UPI0025400EFD|nr:uncharacterized protein N7477_002394 [Penicillium maclennaniae]KAJ5676761.1 hypothetical protein N7477_002394 [Penicillium maclennaniae]